MKVAMFYHSFASCWNHGNAHFLRGIVRELIAQGHDVHVYEPENSWSRANALREPDGPAALEEAEKLVPGVRLHFYSPDSFDPSAGISSFDLVIVHEWTDAEVVSRIGRARANGARFTLLFHDTHHRLISAPESIGEMDLDGYDGVLAFGESLSAAYRRRGWGRSVFTWHEAADIHLFHPRAARSGAVDLVWIGNWGDEERTNELRQYLIQPAATLGLRTDVYGVRYPQEALAQLGECGIRYGGWLPNHRAPMVFAAATATVHVPRGYYTDMLRGIPTIRMFEALACGIPLVSAPWHDDENLFPEGSYLKARSPAEMERSLRAVICDPQLADTVSACAVRAIRERHTCAHRVRELQDILRSLGSWNPGAPAELAEAV